MLSPAHGPASAGVAEHSCGALRSLIGESSAKAAAAASGALEAVVVAMSRHARNASVQAAACAALKVRDCLLIGDLSDANVCSLWL